MRALTAIFQRELMERRLLLGAALLLGLVPLLVPVLPRLGSGTLSELRGGLALALAATFGGVVALILGGSVIARDLAERRISFYFSRPLPGWTIWAGKLAAGAVLALGGVALILLPVLLMGDSLSLNGNWGLDASQGAEILTVYGLLVLLLAGHASGVMLRSRSPWLILDLVALLVGGWLLLDAPRLLRVVGAYKAANLLLNVILWMIPLALLVAAAVQVASGRTDLRRSHRLLSLTLWGLLLPLAFGAQGVAQWVTAVTPRHLEEIEAVIPAPAGDWVYMQGEAVHRGDYTPAFLLNASNGEYVQVPPYRATPWNLRMSFSADGRRAAWTHWIPGGPVRIDTVDLTRPEAGMVQSPITFYRYIEDFALSPDGGRLATMSQGRLQVDEFPSGKMLASVRLPWEKVESARLHFGEDVIRLQALRIENAPSRVPTRYRDHTLYIYEYDLRSKELAKTGELSFNFNSLAWDLANHDDPSRLVLRNRETSSIQIHDARTGELRLALPVPPQSLVHSALLTGDRLALAVQRRGANQLLVLAGDGTPLRRMRFRGPIHLGGQPTPETLVIASGSPERPGVSWLLDLGSGQVKRIGDGLMPLIRVGLQPGSTGARLFAAKGGRLVWIDPLSGQQRVVLPGHG
ncbi:MAG TPA: hypothetical protein VEL74_04210 [Thermoanaerobaculia bacterium]|nr:hypothetical protein [Thermoanaerobaculia bacterium]